MPGVCSTPGHRSGSILSGWWNYAKNRNECMIDDVADDIHSLILEQVGIKCSVVSCSDQPLIADM